MKVSYNLGIDSNQITVGVNIGTTGVAYTAIYLTHNGKKTKIAESDTQSGNIADRVIGIAADLRNSYLIIITNIDFSNLELKQQKTEMAHLYTDYHVSGGMSGNQHYHADKDDIEEVTPKELMVTKAIELI
jgi:hypothetical protein